METRLKNICEFPKCFKESDLGLFYPLVGIAAAAARHIHPQASPKTAAADLPSLIAVDV